MERVQHGGICLKDTQGLCKIQEADSRTVSFFYSKRSMEFLPQLMVDSGAVLLKVLPLLAQAASMRMEWGGDAAGAVTMIRLHIYPRASPWIYRNRPFQGRLPCLGMGMLPPHSAPLDKTEGRRGFVRSLGTICPWAKTCPSLLDRAGRPMPRPPTLFVGRPITAYKRMRPGPAPPSGHPLVSEAKVFPRAIQFLIEAGGQGRF